jgi:transposase
MPLLEGVWQRGISALLAVVGVGCGRPCPRRPEVILPPPRYPSDLSDDEWEILQPLLSSAEKRGRPPKWSLRHVADAVFYLLRSGCSWRMLPKEYPTVGRRSTTPLPRKWRIDGRLHRAHDRLREAVREAEGRDRNPSAAVIDTQVVKTTPVGGPERGYDGGKRLSGRASATYTGGHGRSRPGGAGSRCRPARSGRGAVLARRGVGSAAAGVGVGGRSVHGWL